MQSCAALQVIPFKEQEIKEQEIKEQEMDYVTLGRTGLRVSVMGLGAGGQSRLGQGTGRSEAESIAVVRRALELGINFFDTAEVYGTEALVGRALRGIDRGQLILSTKKTVSQDGALLSAPAFTAGVEESLRRLRTDYIDIYHLHGVKWEEYDHALQVIVPALQRLQEVGKVRFVGITESFGGDTRHEALHKAMADDCWDVMMIGFNMLNQSARQRLFVHTRAHGIGVLAMFVVRKIFSDPAHLRRVMAELVAAGQVDAAQVDLEEPLDFLLSDGDAISLADAAYRFAHHEPGIDLVLSGTGNPDHLQANVASLLRPPLSAASLDRLRRLFARVDSVSGN